MPTILLKISKFEEMTENQRLYHESRRHHWTESEIAYLRVHYADTACCDIADVLGVNASLLSKKAKELGLKKSPDFYHRMQARFVRGYKHERYKNYVECKQESA